MSRLRAMGVVLLTACSSGGGRDTPNPNPNPNPNPSPSPSPSTSPSTSPSPSPSPSPHAEGAAETMPTPPADDPTRPPVADARVRISAEDAKAKRLRAIGFSVDVAWNAMISSPFPAPGSYLIVSGPPGGPLSLRVLDASRAGDDAALRAIVEREYARDKPLEIGTAAEVTLAGAPRRALPFTTGSSPITRTGHCAVLVTTGKGSLALLFSAGIGNAPAPSCADTLAHDKLAPLAASFRLE